MSAFKNEACLKFDMSIPLLSGHPLKFKLEIGETVFVLGANGTGKSSLMYRLYASNRQNSRRISAHRQTWFESNAIQISASQKRDTENSVLHHDGKPNSRWRDSHSGVRASLSIYDLMDAENIRARKITSAVDADDFILAKELRKDDAPIKVIKRASEVIGNSNRNIGREV